MKYLFNDFCHLDQVKYMDKEMILVLGVFQGWP